MLVCLDPVSCTGAMLVQIGIPELKHKLLEWALPHKKATVFQSSDTSVGHLFQSQPCRQRGHVPSASAFNLKHSLKRKNRNQNCSLYQAVNIFVSAVKLTF